MRKFTLLTFLLFMFAMVSKSQTLNNPKDADGYYIVKWNCTTGTWAASNDIEVDQTFVFAVDVTGTPFEAWLKATPTAAGATRALAINKWTNFGDVSGGTNRLKQIKGNIYGATWNIKQMATTMNVASATGKDSVVYVYGQVFGFEFTETNPGAGWWMWPSEIAAGTAINPGTGAIFKTKPYTGNKTSTEFFSDDVPGGLFFSNNTPEKGYTLPCAIATGVSDQIKAQVPIVDHEYYNLQGVKLLRAPQQGLYIHKAIKADGTSITTKEAKSLK
jgi:hypothetical protein